MAAIESGKTHRAGQQGSAGHGRRTGHRGGPAPRSVHSARWTVNTTPSTSACTGAAAHEVRRLILTASGGPFRDLPLAALERGAPRRGAAPPDVADGPENHHRFGDADEQGPRGHRGALAVRRSGRCHRRGDPSAVDRALPGGVDRWLGDCTAGRDGHAAADPVRLFLSRALGRRACRGWTWFARAGWISARPTWTGSRACAWPTGRSRDGATYAVVLNAANEVAVASFLEGRLGFHGDSRRDRARDERPHARARLFSGHRAAGRRMGARSALPPWPAS